MKATFYQLFYKPTSSVCVWKQFRLWAHFIFAVKVKINLSRTLKFKLFQCVNVSLKNIFFDASLCVSFADSPQVVPNRQQHFEYDSIVVSCEGLEGLTEWTVMRKVNHAVHPCVLSWSTGPCNITNAIPLVDSGEYWCEMGGGKRSNTVNITVTGKIIVKCFLA